MSGCRAILPTVRAPISRRRPGRRRHTLADMAADTAGLIDNLGLGSAHLVGISLGGMIAQILAIEHPERVRSLTSIMSTTGNDRVGQSTEAAHALLLMPPVNTREGAMEPRSPRQPRRRLAGISGPRRPNCGTKRRALLTARSIRRVLHVNWRPP